MKIQYWIGIILIGLFITSNIVPVIADTNDIGSSKPTYNPPKWVDGSNDTNMKTLDSKLYSFPDIVVYSPCSGARSESACNQLNQVMHFEKQIWEQNNHLIRLAEYDMCNQWHTSINSGHYGENIRDCMNRIGNETK